MPRRIADLARRLYAAATARDTYAPTAWQHRAYTALTLYLYEQIIREREDRTNG